MLTSPEKSEDSLNKNNRAKFSKIRIQISNHPQAISIKRLKESSDPSPSTSTSTSIQCSASTMKPKKSSVKNPSTADGSNPTVTTDHSTKRKEHSKPTISTKTKPTSKLNASKNQSFYQISTLALSSFASMERPLAAESSLSKKKTQQFNSTKTTKKSPTTSSKSDQLTHPMNA